MYGCEVASELSSLLLKAGAKRIEGRNGVVDKVESADVSAGLVLRHRVR